MAEKRSIFEEVGADAPRQTATTGGLIDTGTGGNRRAIRAWLIVLFALVVTMIVVGGLTRLTDSGLSITEWAPISGAVPPMNATDWDAEFSAYQQTDEFKLQNSAMTLAEFKVIYWWEWGHRQLGRFIGLVWGLGFLYFLIRRQIPAGWTPRLLFLGGLGGLQGAIGWWMVSSGLQAGMLDVASYRLATHLGLAFVILGLIAWYVLRLSRTNAELLQARRAAEPRLKRISTGLMHAAFLQILLGALVAGIDAGRTFVDWPLMNGQIFPPDAFSLEPAWRNVFENPGLVQFMHRVLGYVVAILGVFVWLRTRSSGNAATRFAGNTVLAVMALQVTLGVVTVLYAAPLQLAIIHQLGAVILWVLILRTRFLSMYPISQSVRS